MIVTSSSEKMEDNEEEKLLETNQDVESINTIESFTSELELSCWSVVTYNSVAASRLTYQEAIQWAEGLKNQGVSGLCIITDEAAKRVESKIPE